MSRGLGDVYKRQANCICSCKRAVGVVVGGSAGEDIHLVGSAFLMFLHCLGGDSLGYYLGRTGCSESGEADVGVVGNLGGGFLCRENWECHIYYCIIVFVLIFRGDYLSVDDGSAPALAVELQGVVICWVG